MGRGVGRHTHKDVHNYRSVLVQNSTVQYLALSNQVAWLVDVRRSVFKQKQSIAIAAVQLFFENKGSSSTPVETAGTGVEESGYLPAGSSFRLSAVMPRDSEVPKSRTGGQHLNEQS